MPGLIRKLLIFATVDGLILQPTLNRSGRGSPEPAIQISYKNASIGPVLQRKSTSNEGSSLEAHGIVGLLKVATSSFLISISGRDQVAILSGKPIYSITEVALIPLSSQEDAEKAIVRARESQKRREKIADDTTGQLSDDDQTMSLADDASVGDPDLDTQNNTHPIPFDKGNLSNVAEDIIKNKGIYGRFTEKWFSNKGWSAGSRRSQGLSSEEEVKQPKEAVVDATAHEQPGSSDTRINSGEQKLQVPDEQLVPAEVAHVVHPEPSKQEIPLLSKLLTTTKIFFGSRNFFFSYDYDLSKSVARQVLKPSSASMHKSFDPLFYWNHHLANSFLEAGQDDFVLPLIQGFVGQREFTINSESQPSKSDTTEHHELEGNSESEVSDNAVLSTAKDSYLLTLISRRSIHRAGLRYLRRGVDDDGWVANAVETEQIFSKSSWTSEDKATGSLYSFLQMRGSIPLFFSQSPYSLKPIPVFRGTPEANQAAFTKHIHHLRERYGQIQVASLVEKKGPEAKVGQYFEDLANQAQKGDPAVGDTLAFEWFDFHRVCKGMKFENVSILFDTIKDDLASFGWTEQSETTLLKQQTGLLRTNCMDCLDRTNVVQSACGRIVLETQLEKLGMSIDLQKDPSTSWFNTLWADNGDAISRQYAGTAALKGDFTRTRKRNIQGALNDFGLTLTRYYTNIVNDYFTQASIDYLLGNADENIFIDFEADMKSQDYAIDLRRVRQMAIETCTSICIEDPGEKLISGWALQVPRLSGTLRSYPFEEAVLLLTDSSLYFCRMDWATEKVRSFERIDLDFVETVSRGTYITSTFATRDMDPKKNVGFMLQYDAPGEGIVRVNTRALTSSDEDPKTSKQAKSNPKARNKVLAFKALPPRSYYTSSNTADPHPLDEEESIRVICSQIVETVNAVRNKPPVKEDDQDNTESTAAPASGSSAPGLLKVEEADIISLDDARKSTGYLETLGNSIKKLVWA